MVDIYNIIRCGPCNVISETDDRIPYSCGCVISMGDVRNNYFVYVKDEFMFKRQTMEVYQKTNVYCPNRPSLYFEVAHKYEDPVRGQSVIRFCIDIISFCKQFEIFKNIIKQPSNRVRVKKVTISNDIIFNGIKEGLYIYHFDVQTLNDNNISVNVDFNDKQVFEHIISFIKTVASSPITMKKAIDFDTCYEDAVINPKLKIKRVKAHYKEVYGFVNDEDDKDDKDDKDVRRPTHMRRRYPWQYPKQQ